MTMMFFGQALERPVALQATESRRSSSATEVLGDDERQLAPLAAQLTQVRQAHHLDDYGTLRLAITAIDALGIRTSGGGRLLAVGDALQRREWSPLARMVALAALLRDLGFNAVPYQTSRSEGLLGLPIGDPLEHLDVTRTGMTRTLTEGRNKRSDERHWTFWDGENPLGQGKAGAKPVLAPAAMFEGPQGAMRLLERRAPAFTRHRMQAEILHVPGMRQGIAYFLRPDLADYLDLLPQRPFPHQTRVAVQELEELGMAEALGSLARAIPDESDRIDALLQAFQRHFVYKIGPLRSLHVIFRDRHGDCDQLSVLMAAALHHVGYREADLRTMRWKGHLCLAVRPRSGKVPPGAVSFKDKAGTFVALDTTYYVTRNGEPVTRWGQLADKWARQRFAVGPVDF